MPEEWPHMPEMGMLVKGIAEFGYTETGEYHHSRADPLFCFLGKWVGNMIGKVRVEKELRECKGKTLLHMIRPVTYAHAVTLVEDHQDKWHQDKLVSIMEDKEEKAKYKNHRKIQCPQERLKYAPKKPKYSAGVGVKRRFGDCIWSKSGQERFTQAEEM